MMQRAHVALAEAYPFPDDDTRMYLREYRSENVSQDGKLNAESVAVAVEHLPALPSALTLR
jgi:hypothetical protein